MLLYESKLPKKHSSETGSFNLWLLFDIFFNYLSDGSESLAKKFKTQSKITSNYTGPYFYVNLTSAQLEHQYLK